MQITLQELNMTYPNGKKALQGVSASLDSPSLIGLLGPNGAGKSTLMKLLVAGLLPTGGAIRADGEPLTKCERAYKARLGYLPQDFGLFDELTVEQFLDYMGALKGLRSGRESIRAGMFCCCSSSRGSSCFLRATGATGLSSPPPSFSCCSLSNGTTA